MIRTYPHRPSASWLGAAVLVLLAAFAFVAPGRAEESPDAAKKEALAAMEAWLKLEDAGDHAAGWKQASVAFQKSVSQDQWISISRNVDNQLGPLVSRKFASATYQSGTVEVGAKPLAQSEVTVQYDSSFANLKYAIETVGFILEADGKWRANSYLIGTQR